MATDGVQPFDPCARKKQIWSKADQARGILEWRLAHDDIKGDGRN
jgi:hypothetical protein